MNIDQIWNSGHSDDHTLKPPKPNDPAQIPFTRLIHNLDYLDKLSETLPIDSGLVELIQRKMTTFNGTFSRKLIQLALLMRNGDVFTVELWIIPIFNDGVLIHYLFAADDENLEKLRQHRNPIKPEHYDITSFV